MRSVSGGLNRTLLAICGLVFTSASAWVLLSGLGVSRVWPTAAHYLATAHDQIGAAVSAHAHWLLPTSTAVSACAFLIGLILLAMRVTGSPNKLWLQADASVSKDCEVEWAVAQLRKQLNDDIVTSLGSAPKQIDLLVRLARSTSAKSVSKTVTGQRY